MEAAIQYLACTANGSGCLISWSKIAGTFDSGRYIVDIVGLRIRGDQVLDPPPLTLVRHAYASGATSNGTDYFITGDRYDPVDGTPISVLAVGGRVLGDGIALDADGVVLSSNRPGTYAFGWPTSPVFDGTNYVHAFEYLTRPSADVFAAVVAPDGSIVSDEADGLLLKNTPMPHAIDNRVLARAGAQSVLLWLQVDDAGRRAIHAQHVLAR